MCSGVLEEMCLGVGWLRVVIASMVDVDDLISFDDYC